MSMGQSAKHCEFVTLHASKGIKIADGTEAVNHPILKYRVRRAQCNHKGP